MGAAEVKAGAVNTMSSVSVTEALGSHAHVGAGNETLGHIKEGARMRTPPPHALQLAFSEGYSLRESIDQEKTVHRLSQRTGDGV